MLGKITPMHPFSRVKISLLPHLPPALRLLVRSCHYKARDTAPPLQPESKVLSMTVTKHPTTR
jgi:hypothetical protein